MSHCDNIGQVGSVFCHNWCSFFTGMITVPSFNVGGVKVILSVSFEFSTIYVCWRFYYIFSTFECIVSLSGISKSFLILGEASPMGTKCVYLNRGLCPQGCPLNFRPRFLGETFKLASLGILIRTEGKLSSTIVDMLMGRQEMTCK